MLMESSFRAPHGNDGGLYSMSYIWTEAWNFCSSVHCIEEFLHILLNNKRSLIVVKNNIW